MEQGDKFYDLGSGTGRVLIAAARRSKAEVTGIELSPIFYLITILNFRLNNIIKYELRLEDFFKSDLRKADVVFFFLTPKAIERLKNKLTKELKPGAKVISFAFHIEGWAPYRVISGGNMPSAYFYRI